MVTHESGGKPCSMGTRNWRQPDQCTISSIMLSRLKIFMNTPTDFSSWKISWILEDLCQITFAM